MLVAALLACADAAQALTIPVSEPVLQARVREQFPRVQRTPLGIDVTLADPVLSLADPGGRVGLTMDVAVGAPGRAALAGQADVSGVVRFDPAGGRFLLDAPRLDGLRVPGVEPAYAGLVRSAVNATVTALLQSLPIYTLGDDSFAESYAKRHLRSVRVKDRKLLLDFD